VVLLVIISLKAIKAIVDDLLVEHLFVDLCFSDLSLSLVLYFPSDHHGKLLWLQ